MDNQKIWQDVLNVIKVSVSQANYSTWFAKTFIKELRIGQNDRQTVEIACPSSFVADGLDKRYFNLIQDALNQVTGKKNELDFLVSQAPSLSNNFGNSPLFDETANTEKQVVLDILKKSRIRPGFTFENFAVSGSNQVAWAASEAVSKQLGRAYNPLFIWGGVGVGKTHLMLAIAQRALLKNPNLSVLYCMGEEFTTEIVDAIRNKSTSSFKKRYRNLDLLMVDDVQFIAGKNTVQEEFFHTFNTLLREGGQVILTSDRPPSEIQKLEERLRSRFEAGLTADISPPDFELRSAITLIKAKERGTELPMEVVEVIASRIDSIRRIEGFLTKLFSLTQGDINKINPEYVTILLEKKDAEKDRLTESGKRAVVPQDLIEAVASYFSLGRRKLLGENRSRPIALPRQVLMYLLRVELGLPLTEVGHIVGGRDHTTVMHAVEKISKILSTNSSLREDILGIKRIIFA